MTLCLTVQRAELLNVIPRPSSRRDMPKQEAERSLQVVARVAWAIIVTVELGRHCTGTHLVLQEKTS